MGNVMFVGWLEGRRTNAMARVDYIPS